MEKGEELLLQFLGAGKGKLQGGGAHGKRLSAGKILGVTAGSRGLGLHGEEGPCAGCLGRVRGG
jgi:hypothetical protein